MAKDHENNRDISNNDDVNKYDQYQTTLIEKKQLQEKSPSEDGKPRSCLNQKRPQIRIMRIGVKL